MLWAVIMAGGSGTRFWPESREQKPKQFLTIFGKQTLFQETISRVSKIIPKNRIIVVTQERYVSQTTKLGKISRAQVIGEPVGRNTAPCVVLAAEMILKKDPKAVLAILPSDHRIGKVKLFQKLLQSAATAADKEGMPVTFGIKPGFPHTGYGYLERAGVFGTSKGNKIYRLKQFHEKPDFKTAERFVKSGKFLWNSGMFVWRADALVKAARKYLPQVEKLAGRIADAPKSLKRLYPQMQNISIDYGLMEPMKGKILTVPADIAWCDLGGWPAYQDILPCDKEGNISQGKVLTAVSRKNLVRVPGKLTALVGVENLIVVETKDALLITSRDKAESIREIVSQLKARNWKNYL